MKVTVSTPVAAPIQEVWRAWTTPSLFEQWNAASEDWCCPSAQLERADGRAVRVEFTQEDGRVTVHQTFDADPTHDGEQQREGWQANLDRFARHVESTGG
jgi:uncharacterized protein YndB with AHSA1/START domain